VLAGNNRLRSVHRFTNIAQGCLGFERDIEFGNNRRRVLARERTDLCNAVERLELYLGRFREQPLSIFGRDPLVNNRGDDYRYFDVRI